MCEVGRGRKDRVGGNVFCISEFVKAMLVVAFLECEVVVCRGFGGNMRWGLLG